MALQRHRPFTDEVARFSVADFRRAVGPAWRAMNAVTVTIAGETTVIQLRNDECPTAFGHRKRWLVCRCGRRAMVLGVVPGRGLRCRTCGRWKGRDRRGIDVSQSPTGSCVTFETLQPSPARLNST
jgi:hypothetical protein